MNNLYFVSFPHIVCSPSKYTNCAHQVEEETKTESRRSSIAKKVRPIVWFVVFDVGFLFRRNGFFSGERGRGVDFGQTMFVC